MRMVGCRGRGLALALLCLAAGVASSHGPAHAATIAVTNTNPSGAGSLEDAVTRANALGSGTEIRFEFAADGASAIRLERPLPPLTAGGVTIDGALSDGAPGVLLLAAGQGVDHALSLVSPDNRVRGLAICGFRCGVVL